MSSPGSPLKILLAGKTGQVGRELAPPLARIGQLTALDRRELDLAQPDDIRRKIREIQPDLIVNAAAYTAVDRAESDRDAAHAINGVAPGIMAEEAKRLGALLVHYSTDYIFDGTKRNPYDEDDPTNPLNVYGQTKLEGEQAIQRAGSAHLIFRTSWVYAREGRNFLLTILRLATEREELRIVQDQIGAPTSSPAIAAATAKVLAQICAAGHKGAREWSDIGDVYHMTAGGQTNWYEFADLIVRLASPPSHAEAWFAAATRNRPLRVRRVVPIRTEDYPTPARRPMYSVLSNRRLSRDYGVTLPDWETQLRSIFSDASEVPVLEGMEGRRL